MVRAMPFARQRVAKHIPAELYRGTIGRPFIGNGAVNTPTNCWETVFFVGSAPSLYNAEFQVSSQPEWEWELEEYKGVQRS
jgi:hypothetical protein